MGYWGQFPVKNAKLWLHTLFWHFLIVFHQKYVFLSFLFPFFMKYKISATDY